MLFILLSIELLCLPLFGKDIDYKAEKLPLDTTVYYHILKLEETITLEENDSIILSSISDIKLNYDNSEILICDRALRSVLNFDYTNGNYLERKVSGLYIQHDLAVNYDKPIVDWNGISYKFKDTTEYEEIGLTKEFIEGVINSSFNFIVEENKDNIELLTHLMIPASTYTQVSNQIFNLPINVKFNKTTNEFKTFSYFNFNNIDYFPFTSIGVKIFDEYYLHSFNQRFLYEKRKGDVKTEDDVDKYKLITISKHDSIGQFISVAATIPKEYLHANIFEGFMDLQMINIKDKLYYSYLYDNRIYLENDNVLFNFINLPYISINGLKKLSKENYKKRRMAKYLTPNEIGQYCPVSMIKLLNRKDNLLVLFTVYEEEHPLKMYYILQEYTIEGDLLSQTYFDDHPENQIKNVFYDSKNDYLCFLRKSKKGWTVEKRSFK